MFCQIKVRGFIKRINSASQNILIIVLVLNFTVNPISDLNVEYLSQLQD